MFKRRAILLLFGGFLGFLALSPALMHWNEPHYQGRPLSKLIEASHPFFGEADPEERRAAAQAVREIGTNGIPFLLDWIRYEEPAWKAKVREKTGRFPGKERLFIHSANMANNLAPHAFGTLGPAADTAIQELTALASPTNSIEVAQRAALALCFTARPGAVPPLLGILTNAANPLRGTVAEFVHQLREQAVSAIPGLIDRLTDPDEIVAKSAASSLGEIKAQHELVVPALMAAVQPTRPVVSSFALFSLGQFGTNAMTAIPLIVQNLESDRPDIRWSATNALSRIAPQLLTNSHPTL